jgi:thioredoxin-like negative regulator of GroEL
MSKDSANDICLKKDGTLCVIYVVADKSKSDATLVEDLDKLKDQFTSKIERGITFSFMRLDAAAEPEFAATFKLSDTQLPAIVVLNPGKKARFLVSQKEHSAAGVSEVLDVILGGDARFTRIPNDKLPALT